MRKTDTAATLTNKVYSSSATTSITGTKDDLPVNAFFIKYGTAEEHGVGNVTANDTFITAWYSYGSINQYITIYGLTEGMLLSNYLVVNGDSGGPIYVSGDFVGIITGGYEGGSREIFFTPYSRFKHVFIPRTN